MRLYPKISGAKKELFKLSAVGETIIFTLVIELIPVKSLCVKAGRDEMDEEVEKVEMVNRGFLYLGFFLDKKYNSIIKSKRIGSALVVLLESNERLQEVRRTEFMVSIELTESKILYFLLMFMFRVVAETYLSS